MPQPSFARRVLELCSKIDEELNVLCTEIPPAMMPRLTNLSLASSQLRKSAEVRLGRSEDESARRRSEPTGTVMAQGGPRD